MSPSRLSATTKKKIGPGFVMSIDLHASGVLMAIHFIHSQLEVCVNMKGNGELILRSLRSRILVVNKTCIFSLRFTNLCQPRNPMESVIFIVIARVV